MVKIAKNDARFIRKIGDTNSTFKMHELLADVGKMGKRLKIYGGDARPLITLDEAEFAFVGDQFSGTQTLRVPFKQDGVVRTYNVVINNTNGGGLVVEGYEGDELISMGSKSTTEGVPCLLTIITAYDKEYDDPLALVIKTDIITSGGGGSTTLVAGDKATRIIDDNLETKQIYKGTVINTTDTVPATLPVGAYCFNTATKELYVGAQRDNELVTDTVPMPDDFLFIDTKSGTTYRCDGTTLNNIANIKTINGQSLLGKGNVWLTGADFLLEQDAGLTINEAVNSNTDALQNKLGKDSIVQTTGTATDKVMSQKAVTDDINSAISLARRQGVPQAKCFQFSKNYTFYSGSQLKDKTLIIGLYGGEILKGGSIYYNNSVHELQIGNGEKKRLTGRVNYSDHAETLVVYFDDDGIAHAYMDGKLCYDFPSNTQPDTVTINVSESGKFKQILLLDGDLHQAANDLLWAKGWQDWLINNRNMNTTREVKKIDNRTDRWMAIGTTKHKLYVVDYNITNNTEKEVKVPVNQSTIGYGGDIVIPAGQSVSVRRLIDTSAQGALGYNSNNLPFSLTAKSVAVIKGIDYRYVYNGGYYDLAGLVPTDEPTIIPNPEEYLKIKSNNTYPDAVGQIGYDTTGRLYIGAIDLTWKQINNT